MITLRDPYMHNTWYANLERMKRGKKNQNYLFTHPDDGDFAEAVRARIAELNAKVDALAIAVDRQKTIAQINYLLAEASFDDARPAKPF